MFLIYEYKAINSCISNYFFIIFELWLTQQLEILEGREGKDKIN